MLLLYTVKKLNDIQQVGARKIGERALMGLPHFFIQQKIKNCVIEPRKSPIMENSIEEITLIKSYFFKPFGNCSCIMMMSLLYYYKYYIESKNGDEVNFLLF